MSYGSRTKNSLRNILVGLGCQIVTLFLSFILRTIFIKMLGTEYLGINGLYSNILSVLSLADLGVGNAIIYYLYKPLADNDIIKISSLINFYKKVYRYIALVITIIGLAIVPFLDILIKTTTSIPNLKLYYIIYLSNIVISYLFTYKTAILNADQNMYLVKVYSFLFQVLQFILQIAILYTTHNYFLFLFIQLLFTFLNNIFIAHKSDKLYPYIKNYKSKLKNEEKHNIFNNIKSIFIYRIGGVILNNTDNILISNMIGIIWVGLYSNYTLIVGTIQTFTEILFASINASIGNLIVNEDIHSNEKIFDVINFSAFWIFGFCSICFFILLDDFITLWLGNEFILGKPVILAIVLNFYIIGTLRIIALYRDTTGLFRQTKYIFLLTAIINLILSFILGQKYGLSGILYATAIARLLTNVWFEPMILYKKYFFKSPKKYFVKQLLYFLLITIIGGLIYFIASFFNGGSVTIFIGKVILCFIIPNAFFFILFNKTSEFRYLFNKIAQLFATVISLKSRPIN